MASSLAKMLECPVCFEKMCQPKLLPCGHTFCIDCLNQIAQNNRQRNKIDCPNCRKSHNLPENGVNGFNNNYTLLELISLNLDSSSLPVPSQDNASVFSESSPIKEHSSKAENLRKFLQMDGARMEARKALRGGRQLFNQMRHSSKVENSRKFLQMDRVRKEARKAL